MPVEVSERSFEKTIECGLLRFGPKTQVVQGKTEYIKTRFLGPPVAPKT